MNVRYVTNAQGSTRIATPLKTKERLDKLLEILQPSLENLCDRWSDEKQYEDFEEYAEAFKIRFEAAAQKLYIPEYFKWVRASKRPFGFTISFAECGGEYLFYATSRTSGWKRTK